MNDGHVLLKMEVGEAHARLTGQREFVYLMREQTLVELEHVLIQLLMMIRWVQSKMSTGLERIGQYHINSTSSEQRNITMRRYNEARFLRDGVMKPDARKQATGPTSKASRMNNRKGINSKHLLPERKLRFTSRHHYVSKGPSCVERHRHHGNCAFRCRSYKDTRCRLRRRFDSGSGHGH